MPRSQLGAHAGVIIELDLATAEATNDLPAVSRGEFIQFFSSHRFYGPQFSRMRDETLRLDRKHSGDFSLHGREIV